MSAICTPAPPTSICTARIVCPKRLGRGADRCGERAGEASVGAESEGRECRRRTSPPLEHKGGGLDWSTSAGEGTWPAMVRRGQLGDWWRTGLPQRPENVHQSDRLIRQDHPLCANFDLVRPTRTRPSTLLDGPRAPPGATWSREGSIPRMCSRSSTLAGSGPLRPGQRVGVDERMSAGQPNLACSLTTGSPPHRRSAAASRIFLANLPPRMMRRSNAVGHGCRQRPSLVPSVNVGDVLRPLEASQAVSSRARSHPARVADQPPHLSSGCTAVRRELPLQSSNCRAGNCRRSLPTSRFGPRDGGLQQARCSIRPPQKIICGKTLVRDRRVTHSPEFCCVAAVSPPAGSTPATR